MTGPGIPSAVIRFACHIPLGMLAWSAQGENDIVHKYATRLLDPRFNHNIHRGEKILYIASMFGFWWNFFMWIPTGAASGILLFFLGLVDLGIVIGLVVGVCLQSTYLPHSKGGCRYAETWQVPNGVDSWFHVYANVSGTAKYKYNPGAMCEGLVETWNLGVAMAVMYFISAMFNIILGGLDARPDARGRGYRNYRSRRYPSNYNTPRRPFGKVLLETLGAILLAPGYALLAILPKSWRARIQYSWRYFSKSTKRVPTQDIKLPSLRKMKTKADPTSEKLAHLLSLDVLTLIAPKLHYVDLVSLSLVSRSIRKAIFPDSAVECNAEHFRILTCDDGTKSQCWGCNTQICNGCQETAMIAATEASFHMDVCKAHCSDCYYNKIHRRNYYNDNKSCSCGQGSRPYIFANDVGWVNNTSNNSSTLRSLCRLCSGLPLTGLQDRREARDKDEITRLSRQPLSCSGCKLPLSSKGPRWWICQSCLGECRNTIHPAWAPKLAV